ncbi:glycosyltransferase family 4 protein [Lachnospiraceae bacterium C1.1]|nr:glycosyltransferase family 1 protein [Lachnospiraceae bacterium C1.1]
MRILYDYQALFMQKYGGVSRYFYEIINGMRKDYPQDKININAAISINYYFKDEIRMRERRLKHANDMVNNSKVYASLLSAAIINKPYDIIHPTFCYDDYLYKYPGLLKKSKIIVTIHDMIHERFGIDETTIAAKKRSLERADGIIAVSEYTKKDMLEIYPNLANKAIKVIYHGSSMKASKGMLNIKLPERYLLFVGQRADYKNFKLLIEAMNELKDEFKDLKVLVSGGGDFSSDEIAMIRKYGMTDLFIKKNLDDNELAHAYRNAAAFVYPSKYEGFGIPILEAYSENCPVLLSNSSCFPEIAGDAGIYFDPDDHNSLADAIRQILGDEEKKNNLIEKGKLRLERYSWEKASKETRDFYGYLLNS